MKALGSTALALALLGQAPSLVELGEDVLHLLSEGHTLHETDHEGEDGPRGHGCDDCPHCVNCHGQGTPFVSPVGPHVPNLGRTSHDYGRPYAADLVADGVRSRLERPPRA